MAGNPERHGQFFGGERFCRGCGGQQVGGGDIPCVLSTFVGVAMVNSSSYDYSAEFSGIVLGGWCNVPPRSHHRHKNGYSLYGGASTGDSDHLLVLSVMSSEVNVFAMVWCQRIVRFVLPGGNPRCFRPVVVRHPTTGRAIVLKV